MISHKVVRPLVAVTVGLVLALYSYQRITDPEPGLQRAIEEAIVMVARDILQSYVSPGNLIEIVDAVSPASKVGKSYVYPTDDGWELSGHYRRDENDRWHPYLMVLNGDAGLKSLAVQDGNDRLIGMSAQDPKFSALPP
ncbi:MAG: hypothetical protein V3R21_08260 [Woeseiaceae bacterium]